MAAMALRRLDLKVNVENYYYISSLHPEKVKKLCRVCSKKCKQTKSISMRNEHVVKQFLANYLQIQITKKDVLPYLVCHKCAQFLIDWDLFVKTSQAFENALSKYKNPKYTSNNKICIDNEPTTELIRDAQIQYESIQSERIHEIEKENSELIVSGVLENCCLNLENFNPNISIQKYFHQKEETGQNISIQEDFYVQEENDPDMSIPESCHQTEEIGIDRSIQGDFKHVNENSIDIQEGTQSCIQTDSNIEDEALLRNNIEPSYLTDNCSLSHNVITQKCSMEYQPIPLQSTDIKEEVLEEEYIAVKVEALGVQNSEDCNTTAQIHSNSLQQNLLEVEIKSEPEENIQLSDSIHINNDNIENIFQKDEFCAQLNLERVCVSVSDTSQQTECNNQITYDLTNPNDLLKISKFPTFIVSLNHVNECNKNLLQELETNFTSNKYSFRIITYLRNEIKRLSLIKNDNKLSYCIICKNNVSNFYDHLQDTHVNNINVIQVLKDENSKIQNKILNSVLKKHKSKKISNANIIKSHISHINNMKQLCFDRILDLLPDNIKKEIKKDKILNIYGLKLIKNCNTLSGTNLFVFVSNKLEQLVNLLLTSKELNTNINNLISLFVSNNCYIIFNAIRKLGEYNLTTNKYKHPKIVTEIGIAIKQYTKILCEIDTNRQVKQFIKVFNKLFKNEICIAEKSTVVIFNNKCRKRKAVEKSN